MKRIEQEAVSRIRHRKYYPDIRVNMIPMLNLALLLLISHRIAVRYAPRPGCLEIIVPSKYEILNPQPIPEAKLLRLFVDQDDSFYYQIERSMEWPVKADFGQIVRIITDFGRSMEDPVMLLKLDPRASYESMVRVVGKIQSMERKINNERVTAWMTDQKKNLRYFHAHFILRDMSKRDELKLKAVNRKGERDHRKTVGSAG